MSERSRYVLISLLAVYMETVQSQNELNIAVTNPVRLGQDDLRITCSASGSYTSITSYSIFRNDSSPTLKALVTRTYNVISQSITTTWPNDDHNVQGRAVLSGNPLPFPNSTFILTIPKDEVISPEDSGGFQCQFSATVSPGGQAPAPASTQEFIEIDRQANEKDSSSIELRGNIMFGIGVTMLLLAISLFAATMIIIYKQKIKRLRLHDGNQMLGNQ